MAAAVFLDRDGVINQKMPEGQYVSSVHEFHILPGVVEAIRRLKMAGYLVIVVTNQRGVALGQYTMEDLDKIHGALHAALRAESTDVDGIYVCPHEKNSCECRKPKPGLLLRAKKDFPQIEFAKSIMIGDSESDVQAGIAAGCGTCIRIFCDCSSKTPQNLSDAVSLILGRENTHESTSAIK